MTDGQGAAGSGRSGDTHGDQARIELWRSPTQFVQEHADGRPILIPRPTQPRFVRSEPWPGDDVEAVLMGRHVEAPDGPRHLAWTGPRDREDDQLSRSQLYLTRADTTWTLTVPGPERSKRSATAQYWASSGGRMLQPGGAGLMLDLRSHVCVVVHTVRAFYWALLVTPDGSPAQVRTAPHYTTAGRTGTLTDVDEERPELPSGWKDAVRVKFEPYLRWPMGWRPAPVEPRHYVDPEPTAGRTSKQFQDSVRRRLSDTKEVAIARGYGARNPFGIEVELLEWLVGEGELTFDDRHEWPDDPAT